MCLQAPPAVTNAVDHVSALGGLYINTPSTTKHFLLLEIGAWRAKREIVSFRVARACGAYVRCDPGENIGSGTFPFPFLPREVFPFPLPSKVLSSFSWLYR